MAPKKDNDSTMTPPVSLEDDDQDEDFVASENGSVDSDLEASGSDESSEEGSDADEEEDEEDDDEEDDQPAEDLPAELQDTLRQALEGEKVLDEPILSDSEISREFPEEEDDVLGALAGSDSDSDEEEDEEDETSAATGSEASEREIRRAASTIGAAQSAAAFVAGGGRRPAGVEGASPTATGGTTRRRTRFGEEALSEQGLGGPQLIPLSPQQARRTASRAAAAAQPNSPPLEAYGAMLPPLDDNDGATSRPIAQRTRAQVSLMDVTIEELEDKLGPATGTNEPLLYFGVDDAAEWERFIAGLQSSLDYGVATGAATGNQQGMLAGGTVHGSGGIGTLGGDCTTAGGGTGTVDTEFEDSDDEDFVLELERMLQEDEAARLHHGFDMNLGLSLPDDFFNYNSGGGGGGGKHGKYLRSGSGGGGGGGAKGGNKSGKKTRTKGSGGRERKKQKVEKPPPRRSARLLGNSKAERPLYMASLMDRRTGKAAAAALQQGMLGDNLALQQAYGAQASLFTGLDELATLAAVISTGPPIPLPSELGKPGAAELARTVVWRAPLPKAMRKYENIPAQPDESAPIIGAHFQASQYSDLYRSIHHHVQLLAQTTAMAVVTGDLESAEAGAKLIRGMQEFVENQTDSRKSSGIPAYVSACLGIDTGEGLGEGEEPSHLEIGVRGSGGGRGGGGGTDDVASGSTGLRFLGGHTTNTWTPQNPGNIYTVADVSVLRAAPKMLEMLNLTGENTREEAAAAEATAADGQETRGEGDPGSSEREKRQPELLSIDLDPAIAAAVPEKKRRRRGKKPREHAIWDKLPADVALALVPVKRFFDPAMEPRPPTFYTTSQLLFTPAEDALLAWGIRKHLYDWPKIAAELLPTKSEKILFNRKKNRTGNSAPHGIVKEVVSLINSDLTLAEELLIVQALQFYGRQTQRWQIICKDHLPHRHPVVLSMLWGERQRKIAAASGSTDPMQMDVATVTAAAAAMPRANQGLVMEADPAAGAVAAAAAAAAAEASAAADQVQAQVMAEQQQQQQQFLATQQMAAAAIGASMLPPSAAAAFGMLPPMPAAAPPMQQQQQQQQQVSPGAAAIAAGLAPPRLVEWEQEPSRGQDAAQPQPREAPPRDSVAHVHAILTGRAAGGDVAGKGVPAAEPAERAWSKTEETDVLRAALANAGELGEEQLQQLVTKLNRSKEEVVARSEVLVERFKEKARQRQQQAAAGGAP